MNLNNLESVLHGDGLYYVYPTTILTDSDDLIQLTPEAAWRYAIKHGRLDSFGSEVEAQKFINQQGTIQ